MANNANQPLKTILRGTGTIAGLDLANECLTGSVLPPANGGSGVGGAAPTNGQVLIGNTSSGVYAPGAITSNAGTLAITLGAGTINIEAAQPILKATFNLTAANIKAMYGAPVTILPGVAGKTICVESADMTYTEATAVFAAGGVVQLVTHTGAVAVTGSVGAAAITAAAASYSVLNGISYIGIQGDGIDITNLTGAFTSATGTGSAVINIYYRLF